MNRYAVALTAQKEIPIEEAEGLNQEDFELLKSRGINRITQTSTTALVVTANNQEKAKEEAMLSFPKKEGWYNHGVSLVLIEDPK